MNIQEGYLISEIRNKQFSSDEIKETAETVLQIIQALPTVSYVFVDMRIALMNQLKDVDCWEDFVPLMKKVDEAEKLGAIAVCVNDLGKHAPVNKVAAPLPTAPTLIVNLSPALVPPTLSAPVIACDLMPNI